MSTQAIRRVLQSVRETDLGQRISARLVQAEEDVASIERAAAAIVKWNRDGRPAFDLEAARGYDVLERIADAARESITSDGGTPGGARTNLALPLMDE